MSVTESSPVPKLDLAPRLKRPFALWNPIDYLRLLYWAFYFPQAIRWYVSVIAENETDFSDIKTWGERLRWFRRNPIQAQLWLQGLILQIVAPIAICYFLELTGISVSWGYAAISVAFSVAFSAAFSVASGVASGVALGVAGGVALGVAVGVAGGVAVGVASGMASGVALGVALGVAVGVAVGVASGVASGVAGNGAIGVVISVASGVASGVALGMAGSVALGVALGMAGSVALGVALGMAFGVAFGVVLLRVENWFFGLRPGVRKFQTQKWLLPHITPLPLPFIEKQLTTWLQQDWQAGLEIIDQLLKYTLQFIPVVRSVNSILIRTPPDVLIARIALLARSPWDWNLVRYVSASLENKLKSEFINNLSILPPPLKRRLLRGVNTDLRLDSPVRAAAAGFWYLHDGEPEQAIEAFLVVESLPHGAEMLLLATILDRCQISELPGIGALNPPPNPPTPLLRPESWEAITKLRHASEDIRVVCNAASRTARAFASNRALGDLNSILETHRALPEAERGLILAIAQTWRDSLLGVAGEIGRIEILKPVQNPYVAGDPVEGSLFVGRDDILRQLEELWFMNSQLQSVVLYGHRRMGKTSLLRNVNSRLGSTTQLIYVNLLNLGDVTQGAGEVLLSICDEIAQDTNHPAPADDDLLTLPERTFKRYLQSLIASPDSKGLIIALDEFERLEELISAGKLQPNFLGYLRGLVQMNPKIAFAFAGLHTLEEMTEDYFSPFFASVIPIHLGFLDSASTRQLLANPSDDFPLDYAPEIYDAIFQLTAGQPYLVQLLGFQLVRRYNTQVFEQGRDRSHQFTLDDLHAITSDRELFTKGRYYFTGVWQQAAHSPAGQQEILAAIAFTLEGLPRAELLQCTQLNEAALDAVIETLQRHDVVHEVNRNWCIKVELFRRWVVEYRDCNPPTQAK